MADLRLAVLVSGGGTTLRNLVEWRQAGQLMAGLELVISSNPGAGALGHARDAGIPSLVFDHREFPSARQISPPVFEACRDRGIELIACGGFLRRLMVPADFANRMINIHPSLIPRHCGQGMYGLRVHAAVLGSGDAETGCTVHVVDDEYDHGPVLAQARVPVLPGDTPDRLARRVFAEECRLYPETINRIARGELLPDIVAARARDEGGSL